MRVKVIFEYFHENQSETFTNETALEWFLDELHDTETAELVSVSFAGRTWEGNAEN